MITILFDVDNTLYPKNIGLFNVVDKKINQYLKDIVGIPETDVNKVRKDYLEKYGTTLNGLIKHHNINPVHYLEYVHNVDLENYIKVNHRLKNFLKKSKYRNIIFSNAYLPYIKKILKLMEIEEYFEDIFDITKLNYTPKPLLEAYLSIINAKALIPEKTFFIDDSSKNLLSAKKIGFKTCYISEIVNTEFDFNIKNIHEIEFFL